MIRYIWASMLTPCHVRRRIKAWQIVGFTMLAMIIGKIVVSELQLNHIGF